MSTALDTLREARKLLADTIEAATPGPWAVRGNLILGDSGALIVTDFVPREGTKGAILLGHRILKVNLRILDDAIATPENDYGSTDYCSKALRLARAILGKEDG